MGTRGRKRTPPRPWTSEQLAAVRWEPEREAAALEQWEQARPPEWTREQLDQAAESFDQARPDVLADWPLEQWPVKEIPLTAFPFVNFPLERWVFID